MSPKDTPGATTGVGNEPHPDLVFNADGLIPAIVQDNTSGQVLTLAWMNAESIGLSLAEGRTVFWSRSRSELWRKGETSGHVQHIKSIHYDCDGDALVIKVDQVGGIACHTGAPSCFFRELTNDQ